MNQFNIIGGLSEVFDETCIKQVVSRLTRNPLIWNFLRNSENFNHVRNTLGQDPARWTIAGVLESAAGLSSELDAENHPIIPIFLHDASDIMSVDTSVERLSALSLRILDYIKDNSFGHWLDKLPTQSATENQLWEWSAILSLIFVKIDNQLIALSEFNNEKNTSSIRLLAYAVHSDLNISDYLLENLDVLYRTQDSKWLVLLINHLDILGDFQMIKKFAVHFLELYQAERSTELKPVIEFDELLKKIADNRYLMLIAQKAENSDIVSELHEFSKKLFSELLTKTGISNFDPAIFDDFGGIPGEKSWESNLTSDLQEKIERAHSYKPTDSGLAKLITEEIYQFLQKELGLKNSELELDFSRRHKIIDLFISCDLIVECSFVIDYFLQKYPDDTELLRKAAFLNQQHGNHAKAIRYYQLLEVLDSLSREERIAYTESLAYTGNYRTAYEIRASINVVNIEEVKKLVLYAFNAGLQEEIDKIIKLNPNEINQWELSRYFADGEMQKEDFLQGKAEKLWLMLTSTDEKVLFLKLLENRGEKFFIMNLLENSHKNSPLISQLTIMLINYFKESSDFSSIADILSNIELNNLIGQREFEEGIGLLIEYGFIDKANQWLKKYENTWLLSPEKINFQAEVSINLGDFNKTARLLHDEIFMLEENEKLLSLYSLALLNANPKSFPIGLNNENLSKLNEVEDKFNQGRNFSNIFLRILEIYLNKGERINLFEKELSDAIDHDIKETWRLKAAIANENFNLGRYDLAIQYFKEVERILPFDHDLLKYLLECYLQLKLTDEAEIVLHRLLASEGLTSSDLIKLSFEKYLFDEWISFLDKQSQKFPDSKEIRLLFALSSIRCGNYSAALESIRNFLSDPDLNADEKLIAAQILAAAGDNVIAERTIEILFSGNNSLTQTHYLTAMLIYKSIGKFSKALIMLNHLQPFDKILNAFKLELLLENENDEGALIHLNGCKPVADHKNSIQHDLPLIDASGWHELLDDQAYFEKTAARVWIANGDFYQAAKFLEEGFTQEPNDEHLALLVLETAKLTNRTSVLDGVLYAFDGKEIHSSELFCSLGESALLRGQEVLAANYFSSIVDISEDQFRFKGLQAILLIRNGNQPDAAVLYNEILNEITFGNSPASLPTNDWLNHQLWMATLAYEMDDFSKALEITKEEIFRLGRLPGIVNIFLRSLLGLQRQNIIFEIFKCSSRIRNIADEQKLLFELIKKEFDEDANLEIDDLAMRVCNVYINLEGPNIDQLLEISQDRLDLKDLIYFSFLRNGHEKTEIELIPRLNNQNDQIFLAALLASEHPEKSMELIRDHVNLLSNNPMHLALLAQVYLKLVNLSEAYAAITLALNIMPEEFGWEILAGEISQKRGDSVAAIEHFERANHNSESSLNTRFNDLIIHTESEQAIPILESKLVEDPSNFELTMKIALLCLNFNKPRKAAIYFETARRIHTDNHTPLIGLSKLSAQMGNLEKSLEYANMGLQIHDRDFDLIHIKSNLIKKLNGLQEARDFLENQVLINDELSFDLQAMLADLIFEMHGIDECLTFIASKNFQQTNSVRFLNTRVRYLLIAGDFTNAKVSIDKTLSEYPANAEANALNGEYYRIQGNLDQAIAHYLRAINLDPSNENHFLNLFEIYHDQRDSGSAVETLKSGMKAIPYSVVISNTLAKYYLQLGLIEQAGESIDCTLRLHPHDEEAGTLRNLISQQRLALSHEIEVFTK